jgi:hypothetical protein
MLVYILNAVYKSLTLYQQQSDKFRLIGFALSLIEATPAEKKSVKKWK